MYDKSAQDFANREMHQYLKDNGVQTLIHYLIPPHLPECYYSSWNGLPLPIIERLAKEELSLPISPVLFKDDAKAVADLLNIWK